MKISARLLKQLASNASRTLIIDRSKPQFITYSSAVLSYSSNYHDTMKYQEIPSSSLFDGFIKTTRKMSRFYKRTFVEFDPSSMLVRPRYSEETDDAVHVHIPMGQMSDEDINVSVEKNKTVTLTAQGDGVFEAMRGFKKYVCYIDLPDIDSAVKCYTTRGIKADMVYHTGMVELIILKLKQHENQDDDGDQRNTFNITVNRTFSRNQVDCYQEDDDNDYQDEDVPCLMSSALSSFYAYLTSLIKAIRLPLIINKCVDISSQLFLSTISDGQRLRLNLAVNSISKFIYTNIMNRFGLFTKRVYGMSAKSAKPSLQETDEFLYCHLQLNGVVSHENVCINVNYNKFSIEGAVFDEVNATYHLRIADFELEPEDGYYLKYNMRDIKAEFRVGEEGGELEMIIPKFDAAQRMMNDEKNEAGEFSKLKKDAFSFSVRVDPGI